MKFLLLSKLFMMNTGQITPSCRRRSATCTGSFTTGHHSKYRQNDHQKIENDVRLPGQRFQQPRTHTRQLRRKGHHIAQVGDKYQHYNDGRLKTDLTCYWNEQRHGYTDFRYRE